MINHKIGSYSSGDILIARTRVSEGLEVRVRSILFRRLESLSCCFTMPEKPVKETLVFALLFHHTNCRSLRSQGRKA